jgi:hypothetical protein
MAPEPREVMPIPNDLLEILVCAFCKSELKLEGERLRCTHSECGLVYAIKDDIPIMLVDEAERPCPKCSARRDWTDDELKCPKCGTLFRYVRK